jgi:hypothetical protein
MALATPEKSTIATNDEPLVGLYTLFFRYNTNFLQNKNFRFNGTLRQATERARRHCEIMGYKFHFVQPLISDFDREEKYKLGVLENPAHLNPPSPGQPQVA